MIVRGARAPAPLVVGVVGVVVLVLVGALGVGGAQAAPPACSAHLAGGAGHARCVGGRDGHDGGGGAGGGAGSGGGVVGGGGDDGPVTVPAGPRYRYRYVLACGGNGLDDPTGALCGRATAQCAAPRYQYWQYRSQDGVAWDLAGTRCLTPQEVQVAEAVPGLTLADFRRLPIPPQPVVVEPGNGYAVVGVPLNVVAGAGPEVLQTQLLGLGVSVIATPVAWTWDFGDGAVLGPLDDPGARFPALGTTHTYERGGAASVTLTTTYAGEYSVDGGPAAAVPGTAQVVSAPVPLDVLSGAGALVSADGR